MMHALQRAARTISTLPRAIRSVDNDPELFASVAPALPRAAARGGAAADRRGLLLPINAPPAGCVLPCWARVCQRGQTTRVTRMAVPPMPRATHAHRYHALRRGSPAQRPRCLQTIA